MRIRFDANQEHQVEAVEAVAAAFTGQPRSGSEGALFGAAAGSFLEDVGFANRLLLGDDDLLANIRRIQRGHGLGESSALLRPELPPGLEGPAAPALSIEMETGTGKTYVYLRTMHELHRRYGWTKFVVVVPSVPIREGVLAAIELTREHFRDLYAGAPVDAYEYDSSEVSRLRQFAASSAMQILVITIQAFNTEDRVINNPHDRLSGRNPIEFIRGVRPIVILDEPQNLASELSVRAVHALGPLATLRYSATHRDPYNLLYRLGPVQAYDRGLVKRIEVASVVDEADFNRPYVRLVAVTAPKRVGQALTAKLELDEDGADGPRRATRAVRHGQDLEALTGREHYRGYLIDGIDACAGTISFANGLTLAAGQAHGGHHPEIARQQIRETIIAHLDKELAVSALPRGARMKVLSLFFLDRVANYRSAAGPGDYFRWFEEDYRELVASERYRGLALPEATAVHGGYFAQDREGAFKDSADGAKTKADAAAFELIMRKKAELLELATPLRFIFSHSALGEGWDNPNVFQICVLRETASESRRRQMVGRGLRLPVREDGERCREERLNRLTVIAGERFADFAAALQDEIERDCGESFAGRIADRRRRRRFRLRPGWSEGDAFIELWQRIRGRTRYRVEFDTARLVARSAAALRQMPRISAPRLAIRTDELAFQRDRTGAVEGIAGRMLEQHEGTGFRRADVPDLLRLLQAKLPELTRATLAEILGASGRLAEALENPQRFVDESAAIIRQELSAILVDGVRYEPIAGEAWELRRFEPELTPYDDRAVTTDRSIYEGIEVDSAVEREKAIELDGRKDVPLFIKLPRWFRIPTPVGEYNPDWAIVREQPAGAPTLYLVRETKGVRRWADLASVERQKIACGGKHFAVLGMGAGAYGWIGPGSVD